MPFLRTFTAVLLALVGAWTGAPARASAQGIDLQQGWTKQQSEDFWYRSQGSRIMLFSWFIGLEQEKSENLLSDLAYLESFGFIPAPGRTLPIGFARDSNSSRTATFIGLTCAACHTSRLRIEGRPVIVDGGAALIDFSGFLNALVGSTSATLRDGPKFARFAKRVGVTTPAELTRLKADLTKLNDELTRRRDQNAPREPYGYARVDAFGHIFNRVFSTAIQVDDCGAAGGNCAEADAPVSYPFLWDTAYPQHDNVQWNASAPNRPPGDLARNIGELLGVFGYFDLTDFGALGYRKSSVRVEKLIKLESLVKELWSPVWPANVSNNLKIEPTLAERGKGVYERTCERCHHRMIDRTDGRRRANEKLVPLDIVGTDRKMADNHARRLSEQSLKTGLVKGRLKTPGALSRFGDSASGDEILKHVLAWVILGQTAPDDKAPAQPVEQPPPPPPLKESSLQKGYKARPLNGVWATAPFLHNGSVPSLRELLNKDRVQGFWVGSDTFDPRNIGLSTEKTEHSSWFDATKEGNRNTGHPFGVDLSPEDKEALLEYLKML